MESHFLLTAAIWIPIAFGLVLLAFGNDQNAAVVRSVALIGATIGFLATLPMILHFDTASADMQFVEKRIWIDLLDAYYHLGVDGLSVSYTHLRAHET
ncbi:MAG: NADH-quinone oxidoreductase subunit M, partial [Betaproteobacteria bacterium]|nr:NADH-quinone oxidoreductase subunit M [Betaproteobacteria bacterium]